MMSLPLVISREVWVVLSFLGGLSGGGTPFVQYAPSRVSAGFQVLMVGDLSG